MTLCAVTTMTQEHVAISTGRKTIFEKYAVTGPDALFPDPCL
jgi:hypothetical protein